MRQKSRTAKHEKKGTCIANSLSTSEVDLTRRKTREVSRLGLSDQKAFLTSLGFKIGDLKIGLLRDLESKPDRLILFELDHQQVKYFLILGHLAFSYYQ